MKKIYRLSYKYCLAQINVERFFTSVDGVYKYLAEKEKDYFGLWDISRMYVTEITIDRPYIDHGNHEKELMEIRVEMEYFEDASGIDHSRPVGVQLYRGGVSSIQGWRPTTFLKLDECSSHDMW